MIVCGVPLHGAGAGVCARRRSGFLLLRQKKVTKEKAPLQAASLRFAAGNLWCSRPAGSRSNSLRSAQPVQRVALAPARWGRAQRWPVWMSACGFPSGCAEERKFWRIRARVCLSDAKRREFSETPPKPSTAGCPQRSEGTQRAGSPFFWVRFFGEAKKSTSPAGARPGLRPQQKHRANYEKKAANA